MHGRQLWAAHVTSTLFLLSCCLPVPIKLSVDRRACHVLSTGTRIFSLPLINQYLYYRAKMADNDLPQAPRGKENAVNRDDEPSALLDAPLKSGRGKDAQRASTRTSSGKPNHAPTEDRGRGRHGDRRFDYYSSDHGGSSRDGRYHERRRDDYEYKPSRHHSRRHYSRSRSRSHSRSRSRSPSRRRHHYDSYEASRHGGGRRGAGGNDQRYRDDPHDRKNNRNSNNNNNNTSKPQAKLPDYHIANPEPDARLGNINDDPRGSDPTKRITKKASSRGNGRNTESFDPASTLVRPDLRVHVGSSRSSKFNRPLKHDDVVIVPELFGAEDDWSLYYKLVDEMRQIQAKGQSKGSEWISWHEGAHLISKNPTDSPTFNMIIDRLCEYFNIRKQSIGTRFNWYRDSR